MMSLLEVTPERLPDDELATIRRGWVAEEERNQAYDDAGYQRSGWRSYEHTLLTSLLAHSAWQAAEIDRLREALAECASEPRHPQEDADA